MLPLSIVVLTKNEENNISKCLQSIANVSDDVHVLDSESTDQTVPLARANGVNVHEHRFRSFADQRNWAIDNIELRYKWVFHLDADERFTPELANEIRTVLEQTPSEAGFFVPSKLMLGSKWLKYSGEYPAYQCRLFHRERLRFQDVGHGQRELTEGALGILKSPYLHIAFSKGLENWFVKHARYARLEAEEIAVQDSSVLNDLWMIVTGTTVARRRAAKCLSYRFPARGFLRMVHLLLIKRGILDGRPGIAFARMKSLYESMISVHVQARDISLPLGAAGDDVSAMDP